VKGQKKEILIRQESRHSCRPDIFYFLPTARLVPICRNFLKQLPTDNGTFAFASSSEANALAKLKEPLLPMHLNNIFQFKHIIYV